MCKKHREGESFSSPIPLEDISPLQEKAQFFWSSGSEKEKIEAYLSLFISKEPEYRQKAQQYVEEYKTFSLFLAALHEGKFSFLQTEQGMALKLVMDELALRLLYSQVLERDVLVSRKEVVNYLMARLSWQKNEQFRVLFLDEQNRLLADKSLFSGTVDFVTVYPRQIALQILALGAQGIILVHNHPSGDPTPSKEDYALTERIDEICKVLSCPLKDHIIISRSGWCSLVQAGGEERS